MTTEEHTVENDRTLLTRWDVPCPTCKAQPGQPCRRPNGDKATGYDGGPAFHAKRKGRAIVDPYAKWQTP